MPPSKALLGVGEGFLWFREIVAKGDPSGALLDVLKAMYSWLLRPLQSPPERWNL